MYLNELITVDLICLCLLKKIDIKGDYSWADAFKYQISGLSHCYGMMMNLKLYKE